LPPLILEVSVPETVGMHPVLAQDLGEVREFPTGADEFDPEPQVFDVLDLWVTAGLLPCLPTEHYERVSKRYEPWDGSHDIPMLQRRSADVTLTAEIMNGEAVTADQADLSVGI
jgi:hypothetical protein